MQRWSSGQTRRWHGPHSTCFCRWTARGWYVSVQAMCVGPNSVTTGRSKAAAKWRGPLSVVTSRSARRTHALVSPSDSGGPSRRPAWPDRERMHGGMSRRAAISATGRARPGRTGPARRAPRCSARPPGQGREVFRRPMLGRSEGRSGIKTDHLAIPVPSRHAARRRRRPPRRPAVVNSSMRVQDRGNRPLGEEVVGVEDRAGRELAGARRAPAAGRRSAVADRP